MSGTIIAFNHDPLTRSTLSKSRITTSPEETSASRSHALAKCFLPRTLPINWVPKSASCIFIGDTFNSHYPHLRIESGLGQEKLIFDVTVVIRRYWERTRDK